MEEIKVNQIQTFLKQVGLEEDDFSKLAKEDIEDFSPFVEKAKHGIKEHLLSDTGFLDELVRPYKDAPIGKEKQLKKEARKFFNLQLKEDELAKMPLSEILTLGTEHLKSAQGSDVEKLKNTLTELLEENEKLKNEIIPTKEKEIEEKWMSKIRQKEINEELVNIVAGEVNVPRDNIGVFSKAFVGYLDQNGLKLHIDEKRNLQIRNGEGLPAKNNDGGILRVKDAIKDFATKLQVNVKPVGQTNGSINPSTSAKSRQLLEMMGRGFR